MRVTFGATRQRDILKFSSHRRGTSWRGPCWGRPPAFFHRTILLSAIVVVILNFFFNGLVGAEQAQAEASAEQA